MNVCGTIEHTTISVNVKKYDPTRTTGLRNAFVRELNKRFKEIKKVIRQAIVEEDVFGLAPQTLQLTTPGNRRYAFGRSSDKVKGFMQWLNVQVDQGLLDIAEFQQVGQGVEGQWTNKYVRDSYKRGVIRARYELNKAGFDVPTLEATGGIEISMATPFHIDRLGLLYTRTFEDMRGLTEQMKTQIARVLAQGIADGDNPRLLAKKLVGTIDGGGMGELGLTDTLGRFIPAQRRAKMIARTEIIRSHHASTIQEYRNWAVEGVVVQAEWQTAGDSRVCQKCKDMQGKVFTLDEIEKRIPLHPLCRCVALPKLDEGEPVQLPSVNPNDYTNYEDYPQLDKLVTSQRKQDKVLPRVTNKDFERLCGDTPEKGLTIDRAESGFFGNTQGGNVEILMKTDKFFSKVEVSKYRDTVLEISHIDIVPTEQGKGLGARMFYNIADSAKKNGFKRIELIAAKGEGYNGYISWARYGFDLNPTYAQEITRFGELVRTSTLPEIKDARNLRDLMSTANGRAFWRENGFEFHGVFDLSKDYDYFINYFYQRLTRI